MHPARWSDRTRLIIWCATFVLLAALNYGAGSLRGARQPDPAIFFEWTTAIFGLIAYAFLGGIALLVSAGRSRRELFALRAPTSWRTAAVLMFQVEAIWLIASLALVAILGTAGRELAPPSFHDPARTLQFAANVAVVALVVPAVEEGLSRGVGYWLLARHSVPLAVIATGVAFALGHGVIRDLPAILILGIGFSWLRARTGSLYPSFVLHVLQNGVAVLVSGAAR